MGYWARRQSKFTLCRRIFRDLKAHVQERRATNRMTDLMFKKAMKDGKLSGALEQAIHLENSGNDTADGKLNTDPEDQQAD